MPRVSVVVPNYNHARFLPRRIESILNQTFGDIEVILLDDASTDNSREVIARYADDPRVRCILNDTNSGSVFRQWNKGLREATGEFVWIAESDDYAEPSFLSVLTDRLDTHQSTGLAYCQSWVIDEHDETQFVVELERTWPDSERWKHDFFNNGRQECISYFSRRCVINNASSALLRRSVVEKVGYAEEDWRIAGDWVFWVKMLLASDIVFVAQPLNYWRQHSATVRSSATRSGAMIMESYRVLRYLTDRVEVAGSDLERACADRFHDWMCYNEDYLFGLRENARIYRYARELDPFLLRRILCYIPLAPIRLVGRPLKHYIRSLARPRRQRSTTALGGH